MGRSFIVHQVPSVGILESLYKMRLRGSDQLKTVLAFYDQDVERRKFATELPEY